MMRKTIRKSGRKGREDNVGEDNQKEDLEGDQGNDQEEEKEGDQGSDQGDD